MFIGEQELFPYLRLRYRDVQRCSNLPKVTEKIAWLRFQFYKERIEVEVSSQVASPEDNASLTQSLPTILAHQTLLCMWGIDIQRREGICLKSHHKQQQPGM